ncbi:ArnT family glycosyltransferase [Flavobacterium sp.]|uniref:ArnT family glycosyltransferase n=1 Tax=Flavobacterium sp. TaxID=239 RepID=UPI003BBBDC5B
MDYKFLFNLSKYEKITLLIIVSIFVNNLFIDIMNVDAAQYASISLEMLHSHSYLQVKDLQSDYLDKPPLLFWISSLSLGLFGVCNFAYKIGAFLMLLLSLYSVFRFTSIYYSQNVAKNAVFIFGTCQAFFLMTNDVRTDGILTSSVITAVWLLTEYFLHKNIKYLVFAAVFTAFAMMAKGPVGIIAVLMPVGLQLLYEKKWKQIFSFSWFFYLLIICLLLIPMSYGLYTQFDLHPEKITNGVPHQSGLYFYYWLQSFGRITGENFWDNGLPWHFFIGTISWDFFPWILILYFGLFFQIKKILNKTSIEISSISGFLLLFILFSMSHYKLPHYLFVTFPFASIICADYLETLSQKQWKNWNKIYFGFGIIVLILLLIYQVFFFTELNFILILLVLLQLFVLFRLNKISINGINKMVGYVIVLNLFLSFVFYPKLLTYQADSMAGKWFFENKTNDKVYFLDEKSHSFNFYTKNPVHKLITLKDIDTIQKPCWLFTKQDNLQQIESKVQVIEKKKFENYPITRLKLPFLLEQKRAGTLEYYYLIKIKTRIQS